MQGRVDVIRTTFEVAPSSTQRADAVWEWLETHWYTVIVGVSLVAAGLLLATAAIPPLLAPFVLGPLGAVAMTALLAPKGERATGDTGRTGRGQRPM